MGTNKPIKEIYNVYNNFPIESKYDKWYKELLNKGTDEINVVDVYNMLRQDVFKELAILCACNFIEKNPLEGEMYNGQLLEILSELSIEEIKQYQIYLEPLLIQAEKVLKTYSWENPEERNEYKIIVNEFRNKLRNY